MPFYNCLNDWNGLRIKASPLNPWRKRFPFWPFFVGQRVQIKLTIKKMETFKGNDLSFHLVEKLSDDGKPRMVSLQPVPEETTRAGKVFCMDAGSRITSSGEIGYWVSNRGYNVDNEPIFTTEAISFDSLVIPLIVAFVIPLFCLLLGLILGMMIAGYVAGWHKILSLSLVF
jgi:hypothetical protein